MSWPASALANGRDKADFSWCPKVKNGSVIQIWQCRGEPGYELRVHGLLGATLVDLEGLPLIAVQDAVWRAAVERFTKTSIEGSLGDDCGDLTPF